MLFIIFCDITVVCAVFALAFALKSEVQAISAKRFKRELAKTSATVSKLGATCFGFFSLLTVISYVFNL